MGLEAALSSTLINYTYLLIITYIKQPICSNLRKQILYVLCNQRYIFIETTVH
jgi:hypothetical protein